MLGQNLLSNFTDLSGMVPQKMRNPAKPSFSDTGYTDMVLSFLGGDGDHKRKGDIKNIKWALHRFPELKYHISAIATFTSFTNQYPWVGKDVYGPGGITVKASPKLNQDEALVEIVNQAFKVVKEAGLKGEYLDKFTSVVKEAAEPVAINDTINSDILVIKEIAHKLLSYNDIYLQLYKAAESLIIYSACVVDFSEDYSVITFYSIDELERIDSSGKVTPNSVTEISSSKAEGVQWRLAKDKSIILSDRAKIITDEDSIDNSPVGRIVHYLRIIDILETALSVERLAKSNSFIVWKVGVDGLPGELVTPWLDVYKERVMTRLKAGTDNNNIVQATMSKSLTASHIFVPNYSESPTTVEKLGLDYRPLLTDLEYWWAKVFMALGIPPYYSMISTQSNNINGDVTAFHEGLLGARVRMYQALLEKVLIFWVRKFLSNALDSGITEKYKILVLLPTYVSGGEESRSEYMRRVNQFASAFSTLSVSGLPISPDFAVNLMFPNSDPHEVVDWHTRSMMNPDSYNPYSPNMATPETGPVENGGSPDQYIDDMLNTMESGIMENEPVSPDGEVYVPPEGLSVTNTTGNKEAG
jgi:hypothetical protein